jgi:nucleolar MIF4G domain-containing protein 1
LLLTTGAHFLHTLVMRYKSPSLAPAPAATIYETPDASKESLNLLTLVAELYNVGVVGPKLIYDLIREFIDHGLYETDVEGLLKIVKRE